MAFSLMQGVMAMMVTMQVVNVGFTISWDDCEPPFTLEH
jgi:hypothetical protein